ncbi:MAG: hypothetical protein AAGI63_06130, partial [Planctomycetota bacterium]
MKKIITIARREFTAMVVTKTFVLSLVMMPVLMVGGLFLMPALSKLSGAKDRKIIVADGTNRLLETMTESATLRNEALAEAIEANSANSEDAMMGTEMFLFEAAPEPVLTDEQRLAISDQIRDGEVYALVEIPADFPNVTEDSPARFVSQDAVLSQARRWLERQLREELRIAKLKELGLDPELVAQSNVPVQLLPTTPFE